MRIFLKIKSLQNAEITISFTDMCKSCPSHEFLASQICLKMLLVKIKFSKKNSKFTVIVFGMLFEQGL